MHQFYRFKKSTEPNYLEENKKIMNAAEIKETKEKKYALYRERNDLITKLGNSNAFNALYHFYTKAKSLDPVRRKKYTRLLLEELSHK